MMAEVYLEYFETKDISAETIEKIEKKIKKLNGIYKYLLLPIYVIKKNHEMIEFVKSDYEWFDFNSTLKSITRFLELL